ncbi:hypothetical protein MMU07_12585 [Aquiflexum sp. LQ15W]|nr:hypothetical protein [Cognataquiflexum nitidum]
MKISSRYFIFLAQITKDVNLLVVILIRRTGSGSLFLRSFILPEKSGQAVPRIQDDARPTVISFMNICKCSKRRMTFWSIEVQ